MALEVVQGPPFSGKSRFALDQIERRERAGELGLILIGYTELFRALVPGDSSQYRDETVSETGAPRLAATIYGAAVSLAVERELSGYVVTDSPNRAVRLVAQTRIGYSLELDAAPDDIADRIQSHMRQLRRQAPRLDTRTAGNRCVEAAVSYYRELPGASERISRRRVDRNGRVAESSTPRGFDRALWERGLTPAGRAALADLQGEGIADPTPADVMRRILRDRGIGGR